VSAAGPSQGANSAPPGGSAAAQSQAWGDHTSGWPLLAHELDAWEALGSRATLWWRDDDACGDSPALRRLLDIARDYRVPIAVAAIPASADATLVDAIASCDEASVVQHGYAHCNHACAGERSSELGSQRGLRERLDELSRGRERLVESFGPRFTPILVPPWNRIGDDLLAHVPGAGFRGVSRFGPRAMPSPAAGLREVNTHVDPIAWRRGREFIGVEAAIARLVAHLRARREHRCDADEPTGLLTHHLVLAGDAWDFLDNLYARTRDHRAAAWISVTQSFEARATPLTSSRSA
jgi:peptidoglycan/xylan/chitin deacetylase (PgdA/CDA1 family)